jgi:hypothetical protein
MVVRPVSSNRYPAPPPSSAGLFIPSGVPMRNEIREPVWAAVGMYDASIRLHGKPYPGWESFERELASQFATLLMFLRGLPREGERRRLLELFLDALNFDNKRGRTRKAKAELAYVAQGQQMSRLWTDVLHPAWRMKASLERMGQEPTARLNKHFANDVCSAVLAHKATPESSVAKLFARRNHISVGTARNALRAYQNLTSEKIAAQV